jgi:DNA (cytosine-5)-methyltransferase 1
MVYGSVCSGIEAATVAWGPLGWWPAFFSEIEPFPSAVLAHHYPGVPNYGDLNNYETWPRTAIDVLCGGTPCQSFSIAGLRAGIHDSRGNLLRIFLEVADRYRPRWVLWENVPGVRSSDDGRALGSLFGGLGELGYGYAWASLDAQYRGLAQRRDRVFVVGCARGWQPAAAVLFDAACMRGDSAPRRQAREATAGTLTAGAGKRGAEEGERGQLIAGTLDAHHSVRADSAWNDRLLAEIAPTLLAQGNKTGGDRPPGTTVDTCDSLIPTLSNAIQAREAKGPNAQVNQGAPLIVHTLRGEGFDASEDGSNRGAPLVAVDLQQLTHPENRANPRPGDPAPSINTRGRIAAFNLYPSAGQGAQLEASQTDVASACLARGTDRSERGTRVACELGVRRLTPRECERLMGFPDDYTLIPRRRALKRRRTKVYREIDGQLWQMADDGPRYKALGNSWAVPVVRWIGERIDHIDGVLT